MILKIIRRWPKNMNKLPSMQNETRKSKKAVTTPQMLDIPKKMSRTPRPEVKVTVTQKKCPTLSDPKMYTHTKWDSYLKRYKRYAPDTIFLELRPKVKDTMTQKQYLILLKPKIYPHTKFGFLPQII